VDQLPQIERVADTSARPPIASIRRQSGIDEKGQEQKRSAGYGSATWHCCRRRLSAVTTSSMLRRENQLLCEVHIRRGEENGGIQGELHMWRGCV